MHKDEEGSHRRRCQQRIGDDPPALPSRPQSRPDTVDERIVRLVGIVLLITFQMLRGITVPIFLVELPDVLVGKSFHALRDNIVNDFFESILFYSHIVLFH